MKAAAPAASASRRDSSEWRDATDWWSTPDATQFNGEQFFILATQKTHAKLATYCFSITSEYKSTGRMPAVTIIFG